MRTFGPLQGLPRLLLGALVLLFALPALATGGDLPLGDLFLAAGQAVTQEAPPEAVRDTTPQGLKRLTIDDYALWRSVGQTSLSPDGRWVTYAYSRREVDDSLFIKPRVGGDPHVVVRGSGPQFSADSRWVAYYVNPEEEEDAGGGQAPAGGGGGGRGRGGGGGQARALELFDLVTQDTVRWENVQSFGFADAGSALVVKKRKTDSDAEHDGTDLVVRYLSSGEEELLAYVGEFGLDEPGGRLAYTLDTPEGESNGVHLLDLNSRARRVLDTEREVTYQSLTWGNEKDEPSADALAVLKGSEDEKLVEQVNALLLWPVLSESTDPVVLDPRPAKDSTDTREPDPFPENWVLSEGGALSWAHDASRLFVATKPQLPDPKTVCKLEEEDKGGRGRAGGGAAADSSDTKADSAKAKEPKIVNLAARYGPDGAPLGPEETLDSICPEFVADVDIWHVGDERIQSVQIVRGNRDKNQTYQSVVHVEGSGARFVQLADKTMETLQRSDDGLTVMGRDDKPYRSDWLPSYTDYYLVDSDTGERTLVLEKQLRTLGFSPDGQHYLYWKDANVWSYEIGDGSHVNLTESASVTFQNEEEDHLGEKPPHGIAGWPEGGESVLLNHKYDVYLQPLDGSQATNLTRGVGAEREIRFRLIDLEPDEDEIDLDEPLYMTAYGQWTKKAGFYRLDGNQFEALVMDDARFGRPQKADSTDVVLFTRGTFETFPDYYTSSLDFSNPVRFTEGNPQQSEFNWGRRILFDYETQDGVRLQGTLAIPNDYVEGEKRPMLINFYEKNSQNLHSYTAPGYRSSPNFAGYVSAGYLVMQPDIHFRTGPSHGQMLECIDLAVDKVIEMGYVDPDRIGIHGHSYSGQGAAYISTHSDRYAAIVAGAAASNLVSDFNQLWKSSGSNQHGYDTYGQGRFGTNPYDDFELFVDQSAAQNADQMNTNLLILHGTNDGSVEWLQGVEFYNGIRWNGGNVILLSYPGEGHGLGKYENQKDFQIRMRQFFDHHLWGKTAPKWMESGRTLLQKNRDLDMMKRGGNGSGG